jgi:hypothetical protein
VVYLVVVFSLLCLIPSWGQAEEQSPKERILSVFYPYRQGSPQVESITPGMRIGQGNFQMAKEVLPPEILRYLQEGGFSITVQETTDLPPREEYLSATLKHHAQVGIKEGEVENYVAGRPFPGIDLQDAKAGEKVAWNLRYQDQGETVQYWPTNEERNQSGAIERVQKYYVAWRFGIHRPQADQDISSWKKQRVYSKRYMLIVAPSDMNGSQVLTHFHDEDAATHNQWAYDPQTRRTRKVVYNPYESPGGGALLLEDIWGFYGYIHPYEWKYLGEKVVLAPGPIKRAEPTWGGRGNWYPVDPWELRKVVVVEATPKQSHPVYSRRVLYIDLQTHYILYTFAYDHEGSHKRTFLNVYLHPEFAPSNNQVGILRYAAQASIDYQWEHASIFQTHKVVRNEPMSSHRFSVRGLMFYGK